MDKDLAPFGTKIFKIVYKITKKGIGKKYINYFDELLEKILWLHETIDIKLHTGANNSIFSKSGFSAFWK